MTHIEGAATTLPSRLVAENCREGRHVGGPTRGGIEYAGSFQGGEQTCIHCGARRSVSGGKSYEPPYWETWYGDWIGGRYAS